MKQFVFASLLLLTYFTGTTQIVNIEDKRGTLADTSRWAGFADLKFNLVENGNSVLSIIGDIRLEYLTGRHFFLSLSNYHLGKVAGADFINQGFEHLRYNFHWRKKVTWEVFTQAQYNERIKLHLRWLLGGGPRFELFNKGNNRFYLGTLYMYEYNEENFDDQALKAFHRDHRLSAYLSFSLQTHKHIRFAGTTYVQPVLNDFSDIRISSQTSMIFTVSDRWSFSSAFSITYDSDVPEGAVHTIYQWRNGFRWNF